MPNTAITIVSKGYVTGDVFPIIQYIDKLTEKATKPEAIMRYWNERQKGHWQ